MKKIFLSIICITFGYLHVSSISAQASCFVYSDPDRPYITEPEPVKPSEFASARHRGVKPNFYDSDQIKNLIDSIPQVGPGETCQTAQLEILNYLNGLKASNNPLVAGLSFGPVQIEAPDWVTATLGGGHYGVAIFETPANGDFVEAAKQGFVIEQTNFTSNQTGYYLTRDWKHWETPGGGLEFNGAKRQD